MLEIQNAEKFLESLGWVRLYEIEKDATRWYHKKLDEQPKHLRVDLTTEEAIAFEFERMG